MRRPILPIAKYEKSWSDAIEISVGCHVTTKSKKVSILPRYEVTFNSGATVNLFTARSVFYERLSVYYENKKVKLISEINDILEEKEKLFDKNLKFEKILGTQNDIVCSKELLLKHPELHDEISDLIRISAP